MAVVPAAPSGLPPARQEAAAGQPVAQPDAPTAPPPAPRAAPVDKAPAPRVAPVDRPVDDVAPVVGDTSRAQPPSPLPATPAEPEPEPEQQDAPARPFATLLRPWSVSLLLVGLVAVAAVTLGSRLPDDRAVDPTTPPGDGGFVITAGPGYGPPLPPGSGPPTAPPTASASAPSAPPGSASPVPAPPVPTPPATSRATASNAGNPPGGSAPKTNGPVAGLANPSGRNLALNRPASASSFEKDWWSPAYAVDGDASTRWGSVFSDPQWISVDLGDVYAITTVSLNWEHAYATAYHVDVSVDGVSWKRIFATTSGAPGPVLIPGDKVAGRFVRVTGTKRVSQYGYSLWELGVS
ncbi:discoidin domain-containing protein [Micromonospora sp. NPDC048935]|uniref:discoidin domain-containing protein n=1 Tax=Micromonospora sp. NPDC048935 TaxID=3364262 RepID=UPI00371735E8